MCNGKNKFTYCTDLGYITDEVKEAITGSHTLYIESNHDVNMLKKGGYPYFLKQRILSKNGHISYDECANIVADMAIKGSKNIILAHLSEENNRPDIALLQTETDLYKIGADKDVSVMVATKINTQPPVVME